MAEGGIVINEALVAQLDAEAKEASERAAELGAALLSAQKTYETAVREYHRATDVAAALRRKADAARLILESADDIADDIAEASEASTPERSEGANEGRGRSDGGA